LRMESHVTVGRRRNWGPFGANSSQRGEGFQALS
jgi:hypothetical protein